MPSSSVRLDPPEAQYLLDFPAEIRKADAYSKSQWQLPSKHGLRHLPHVMAIRGAVGYISTFGSCKPLWSIGLYKVLELKWLQEVLCNGKHLYEDCKCPNPR